MTTSRSRGRKLFGYLGRIGGGLGLALGLMVGTVTVSQSAFATTTSTLYAAVTPQGTGSCSTITDACSLSTAISQAASGDIIVLVTPGTSGTYGAQTIPSSLTITIEAAPGVADPTIDGQGTSSITVDSSANLTLVGVTISGNSVSLSGGVVNAQGGGIYNSGNVTIDDSTISSNTASASGTGTTAQGGGIYNMSGTVTINDSTISNNSASASASGTGTIAEAIAQGGGIYNMSGTLTINDSTISGNSVSVSVSVTGTNAEAFAQGGGIYNMSGTVNLTADLLANPSGACSLGTVDTDQYVFTSNHSCDPQGSAVYYSPLVGSDLHNITVNGVLEMVKPTTVNPTTVNPAIAAIETSTGLCPPADQRGYVPASGATTCDAGAYQTSYVAPAITFSPASTAVAGTSDNLSATSTSHLPITFSVVESSTSVCSIADTTVSFNTNGTCTIEASQAGGMHQGYYYAPASTTQSINVSQAIQTITFSSTAPTNAQVGQTYTPVAKSSSGLTVSFAVPPSSVCSISSGVVSFTGAGTCTVTASQGGNSEYAPAPPVTQSISVSQATQMLTQTITFSSTAPTNAQVGQTYTPIAKSSSGLTVSFAVSPGNVCSISSGVVSFTGAGTCSVTASQGGDSEYAPASTTQSVNVVAVPVTSSSSTTPSTTTPSTPAPKTSSSTTSTPITKPQSVTIKTGPPVAPSTTTPLVPIGLGLGASGVLGLLGLNRKRRRAS